MMNSFGITRLALGVIFGVSVALSAHAGGGMGDKGTIGIVCQTDDGKLYRYSSFDNPEERNRFRSCVRSAVREWAPLMATQDRLRKRARDADLSMDESVSDGIQSFRILQESLERQMNRIVRKAKPRD